jgi:hypothetical protein
MDWMRALLPALGIPMILDNPKIFSPATSLVEKPSQPAQQSAGEWENPANGLTLRAWVARRRLHSPPSCC